MLVLEFFNPHYFNQLSSYYADNFTRETTSMRSKLPHMAVKFIDDETEDLYGISSVLTRVRSPGGDEREILIGDDLADIQRLVRARVKAEPESRWLIMAAVSVGESASAPVRFPEL
jgi:hypothetical protein